MKKKLTYNQLRRANYFNYLIFICGLILVFMGFICIFFSRFYTLYGDNQPISTVINNVYYFKSVKDELLQGFISECLSKTINCTALFALAVILLSRSIMEKSKILLNILILAFSIMIFCFGFFYTIHIGSLSNSSQNNTGKIENVYKEKYVDAENMTFSFPKKERNVITIYANNLETTFMSEENGGGSSTDYIPEITSLFSKSDVKGTQSGFNLLSTCDSSLKGIVSQTSGVPLYQDTDSDQQILPKTNAYGKILQENGYTNEFLYGKDITMTGLDSYLSLNGDYQIKDLNYARDNGVVNYESNDWWGLSDHNLLELAKTELDGLSNTGSPFNLTILTSDLQTQDEYCEYCEELYEQPYLNKVSCSSRQIGAFIDWCKEQSWYKNTTIIISTDSANTSLDWLSSNGFNTDNRKGIYSVLNAAEEDQKQASRKFSSLDIYPTTLASLGVSWQSNGLGLGINLFSDEETLCEIFPEEQLETGLNSVSKKYRNEIYQTE